MRAEAHSCSLSEVGTKKAFDRESLCDWYTRTPPTPTNSLLPNTHTQSPPRDLITSSPHLRGTTLQFLVHIYSVITAAESTVSLYHSSHFRTLDPVLQRKWLQSILHFWVGVGVGVGCFCLCGSWVMWLRSMLECRIFWSWLEEVPVNKRSLCSASFPLIEATGPWGVGGQRECASSLSVLFKCLITKPGPQTDLDDDQLLCWLAEGNPVGTLSMSRLQYS